MGNKYHLLYVGLSILSGIAFWDSTIFIFISCTSEPPPSIGLVAEEQMESTNSLVYSGKIMGYLYFADKENNFLIAEERLLVQPKDPEQFGRIIIEALIKGPNGDLLQTIPKGTDLRAFYVTQDKTAFVDLSEAVRDNHPGGSQSEFNAIYSIVNSLVLNVPEIDQVKILIGGRESMTLAGHIDLRFPFKDNMLIVR